LNGVIQQHKNNDCTYQTSPLLSTTVNSRYSVRLVVVLMDE